LGSRAAAIRFFHRAAGLASPTDVKRPTKPVGRSSCEAHRSFIEAEIAKGRNAVAIN
jgi:hypothetical protein